MSHARHASSRSAQIASRVDPRQDDQPLRTFTGLFWSKSPESDQSVRSIEHDLLLTTSTWLHFTDKDPDSARVLVDNFGDATTGKTVIRVITPDMPFIIDSVLLTLSQHGCTLQFLNNVVFSVRRDQAGHIVDLSRERAVPGTRRELVALLEVDRITDPEIETLRSGIGKTLADVRTSVSDFPAMRHRLLDAITDLEAMPPSAQSKEAIDFLNWLGDNHFTFLGYREFRYEDDTIVQVPGSALGILRDRAVATERRISEQPESTRAFLLEPTLLSFSKSGTLSRVHRPAYPDYVGIREIDAEGRVIGERGFLGLYTSRVYLEHPASIPTVRNKVANIMQRSNLDPNGFDGKVLAQVLATWPRDELMQIDEAELREQALAITHIHERRHTRVFTRFDRYGLFVTCLVYLPRDLYNTRVREKIEKTLIEAFDARHAEFQPYFSESVLVRLHFTLRINPGSYRDVDLQGLEARIVELTADWSALLAVQLSGTSNAPDQEVDGRALARRYTNAFSASYREQYTPAIAAADAVTADSISKVQPLVTTLWRDSTQPQTAFHIKLFHQHSALPLSDVIPALENMGLRVLTESSHVIRPLELPPVHLQDLTVEYHDAVDLAHSRARFADALTRVWYRDAESDRFNQLLFAAGLDTDWIAVFRAYARYNKQLRFGFSLDFIADTLAKHPGATRLLRDIFDVRFEPAMASARTNDLTLQFNRYADGVAILNEDRVLRRMLELMLATERTNFYQSGRSVLALKFAPGRISGVPLPVPAFEIFVSAPHVEGVHLRGGPIARGGLRWSDRHEDYRTEVLGLVKAQTVKNAVIVPTGAKGGFVVRDPAPGDRAAEGRRCYADFVSGLLDLTDNFHEGRVVHPENTRCHDGDDPYLVVAADKGTATYSDLANSIALARNFWLGDAFASGGSNGYDHKKMGITARGAWISVQRHFAEMGIDVSSETITVVGIGDMSGDVFGNGMLQSSAIALVAAFDHRHIFIDPDPRAVEAFAERERLYCLPRSSWADYDASLISTGGGVFARDTKSISISAPMRARFAIDAEVLSPDELIHHLLRAPVDLIWNGGIGTWIKASHESHEQAGDRTNDTLRVDARDLRCKAIGEGGNLGVTQAGRIEFSLRGGRMNTDFIDNSAGVDCSDHEVNLKILLGELVTTGEITLAHRNHLLEEMTPEISALVLASNEQQTQILSLAEQHSPGREDEYRRCISTLERDMGLNRRLEGLPEDAELIERSRRGMPLTRPELSVLLAYAKMHIKRELVAGSFPADPAARELLLAAFPSMTASHFGPSLDRHPLRAEIIATQAANQLVLHLGITSLIHIREMAGGSVDEVARGFFAASHCLSLRKAWRAVDESAAGESVRTQMRLELIKLARHATRWLLRNRRNHTTIAEMAGEFMPVVQALESHRVLLTGVRRTHEQAERVAAWTAAGVSHDLASRIADAAVLVTAFSIGDAAAPARLDVTQLAQRFADLGNALGLYDLAGRLRTLRPDNHWQAMERDILIEDVANQQSRIAARIAMSGLTTADWLRQEDVRYRNWMAVVRDLSGPSGGEFAMLTMTCRKLQDLWKV